MRAPQYTCPSFFKIPFSNDIKYLNWKLKNFLKFLFDNCDVACWPEGVKEMAAGQDPMS